MFRTVVVSVVMLTNVSSALPHSWYPYICCSREDCYMVPVKDVRPVPGGWIVEGRTFIAYKEARPSEDKDFHICRKELGKGELIRPAGELPCFWAPVGSS